MTAAYSFGAVRYHHDIETGEFVNLGIVVFSPEMHYLKSLFTNSYARITAFFDNANGPEVRSLGKALESALNKFEKDAESRFPELNGQEIKTVVARVLPPDDSAIQFEAIGAGVSYDLDATLEDLFHTYVDQHGPNKSKKSRSDDEVLSVYRRVLEMRELTQFLQPKVVGSQVYQHVFPMAWKNGTWNSAEAVSFDLIQPTSIVEKANTWLGRLHSLSKANEGILVHLLLGKPSQQKLQKFYSNAKEILGSAPNGLRLYDEDDASEFADQVARDVANRKGLEETS